VSRDFVRFPVADLEKVRVTAGHNPRVAVYVPTGRGKVIVCPTESVLGGILEGEPSDLLSSDIEPEVLGQKTWEALLHFRTNHELTTLRSLKKTDWAAFRASGLRTVQRFEETFVRVHVEAQQKILQIEAAVPEKSAGLVFVGSKLATACEFDRLGELIRVVSLGSALIADHLNI
jgi:hypothetical protein